MSYDNEEARAAHRETQRRVNAQRERADWAELQHIYERCVAIAEHLWNDRLAIAQHQQYKLAEAMRDRVTPYGSPKEIPVPLFTPRDRLQFLKEVSTALLIDAGKRNLRALYREVEPHAETQPEAPSQPGIEAASGANESPVDEMAPKPA